MARPLSYPFGELKQAGGFFSSEFNGPLYRARECARRYALKHFNGDTIKVTMVNSKYLFERIAKPQAVSE